MLSFIRYATCFTVRGVFALLVVIGRPESGLALGLQRVRIHKVARLHLLGLRVHELIVLAYAKLVRQDLMTARDSLDETRSLLALVLDQNLERILLVFAERLLVELLRLTTRVLVLLLSDHRQLSAALLAVVDARDGGVWIKVAVFVLPRRLSLAICLLLDHSQVILHQAVEVARVVILFKEIALHPVEQCSISAGCAT